MVCCDGRQFSVNDLLLLEHRITYNMASTSAWGYLLRNGSRIVYGSGAVKRSGFPPELNIPGTITFLHPGHAADASIPVFTGAMGYFPFDTSTRMPRHVHMSTGPGPTRYITEKVFSLTGVGLAELAGEVYVVPPHTLMLIAPGVPHCWTACPAGIDLTEIGVTDEKLVSDGTFSAMFEYEDATTFYPTKQTHRLESIEDYVACEDLQSIRFPEMSAADVRENAWFLMEEGARKADGTHHV